MSTNKDVFPNCQPLQHLQTEFGDGFEVRTRSWQSTKELKRVYYWSCEAQWGIRGWIWENDSQPWTHWVTTRINTRIHQALNHISWGWELLYSCPLKALYPFYCFESSSCLLLLLLWPLGQYPTSFLLLSCTTVSPMRKRQSDCDLFHWPWCFMFTPRSKKYKIKYSMPLSLWLFRWLAVKRLWWNDHCPKF